MRATRTDFGVRIEGGPGLAIDLVEHLLAALGGLGIHEGVSIEVEGPELPILDGGAVAFADALRRLEAPRVSPSAARLYVARAGVLEHRGSRYRFTPGDGVELEVETVFDVPGIGAQRARWGGDAASFLEEIAPARTFGFVGDGAAMWSAGRAMLAFAAREDREAARALARAVLLFDEMGRPVTAQVGAREPQENEVARHKLLDLVGDFALYGGPPRGSVFASRPGHTATHAIISEGLGLGLLSTR